LWIGSWHGPVVVERSTPYSVEQNFHDAVAEDNICTNNLNEDCLL
jgi:hypothetical protein